MLPTFEIGWGIRAYSPPFPLGKDGAPMLDFTRGVLTAEGLCAQPARWGYFCRSERTFSTTLDREVLS